MPSRRHLRFLLLDELVGSIVVNAALNGALGWVVTRKAITVPFLGVTGFAADTLVTSLVLPVITALLAGVLVRLQVRRGLLPVLSPARAATSFWARKGWLGRGGYLGLISLLAVGTPVVACFWLMGVTELSPLGFIELKALYSAGLGAVVTPLLGWWALEDASRAVVPRSDRGR